MDCSRGVPPRKFSTAAVHSNVRPEPAWRESWISDQRRTRASVPMADSRTTAPQNVASRRRRAQADCAFKPVLILQKDSQASEAPRATIPARAYVKNEAPRHSKAMNVVDHVRRRWPT